MSFFRRLFAGEEELLQHAQQAYDTGALDDAINTAVRVIERNPKALRAHLLVARSLWKADRYPAAVQVLGALVVTPEVRGHAPLEHTQVESILLKVLLSWARRIEETGFLAEDLGQFQRAIDFYCGPFGGAQKVVAIGLSEGLAHHQRVTQVFSEMLGSKHSS